IFPDINYSDDSTETSNIYEGFLHLEKYYYRETKKHLTFVPVYSNKEKREVYSGKAIQFTGNKNFIEERREIAQEIQKELNRLSKFYKNIFKGEKQQMSILKETLQLA